MSDKSQEPSEVTQETPAKYTLYVRLSPEMGPALAQAAELASKLGLIPKPVLAELISLFVGWGMAVLKKHWMDKMGYK